jgi:hypothetical protein
MKRVFLAGLLAACDRSATPPDVVPGERVGPVALDMRWSEVRAALGAPPSEPVVQIRLGQAHWPAQGIDVLFTSPDDSVLAEDARVIGVAVRTDDNMDFGEPTESYGGRSYYRSGVGIEDGRVAVFPAEDAPRREIEAITPPQTHVEIDGRSISVIDMHLHPGNYKTMAPTGKAFVTGNLPEPLQIYAPELLDRLSDPWSEHVGIVEQTVIAGVDHAVLFAVYAAHSTGTFSNEELLAVLDDPRNAGPWAWGLASIDFDDWTPAVAETRLAGLHDLLVSRPDRLIGIKLAHAHQGVALDDDAYLGVYKIADETNVPVLLHTGFSPFPGTQVDPRFYDPSHLDKVLAMYPDVDIVLSHVGQGDARAVAHALDLAATHEHVWLEVSALGRPLLISASGDPVTTTEPQYKTVLASIRERGLIGRTLFASDGPQYSGAVRGYVRKIVDGMHDAGYSVDEIEAVMSGNFKKLFRRAR